MKEFLRKNRQIILYVIFGGLTTAVNFVSYLFLTRLLNFGVEISTALAWFLSVLFAYATNRTWVFESSRSGASEILREAVSFFASRVGTGLLDWLIMFVFVSKLGMPDLWIKLFSNVIVIVLNYVLSRFLVFGKKE